MQQAERNHSPLVSLIIKGGKAAALWRGLGLPSALSALLILLAAVGAPLSQVLRVAEVAPAAEGQPESRQTPQYTLVLAGAFEASIHTVSKADVKASENKKTPAKQNDVRLLKILDEQWESTARVQFLADVPAAPELDLPTEEALSPEPFRTVDFVCLVFSPPNPPARGPPL